MGEREVGKTVKVKSSLVTKPQLLELPSRNGFGYAVRAALCRVGTQLLNHAEVFFDCFLTRFTFVCFSPFRVDIILQFFLGCCLLSCAEDISVKASA